MKNIFNNFTTKLFAFCIFFLSPFLLQAQSCPLCGSLDVHVTGIRSNTGIVRILLTFDKESFFETTPEKISAAKIFFRNEKASTKGVTFHFEELQSRPYAFKIFHDENSNSLLDVSLIGKPLEGLALSELRPKSKDDLRPGSYSFEKISFRIPPSKKVKKELVLFYLP